MSDASHMMTYHDIETQALLSRFALRVAARLSEQCELPQHDVSERLRFARERAIDLARAQRIASATPVLQAAGGGAAVLMLGASMRSPSRWFVRFASVLPLLALVAGLVLIQNQHVRARIAAAAEIDFDLLSDELPPMAYGDPGFLEFLKATRD
jgi:hypothetical protein